MDIVLDLHEGEWKECSSEYYAKHRELFGPERGVPRWRLDETLKSFGTKLYGDRKGIKLDQFRGKCESSLRSGTPFHDRALPVQLVLPRDDGGELYQFCVLDLGQLVTLYKNVKGFTPAFHTFILAGTPMHMTFDLEVKRADSVLKAKLFDRIAAAGPDAFKSQFIDRLEIFFKEQFDRYPDTTIIQWENQHVLDIQMSKAKHGKGKDAFYADSPRPYKVSAHCHIITEAFATSKDHKAFCTAFE
ncbi:MAG: hypothetical protein ACREBW_04675, partial [Candidatus Micrarchaeaceae archaeon]